MWRIVFHLLLVLELGEVEVQRRCDRNGGKNAKAKRPHILPTPLHTFVQRRYKRVYGRKI
jgi:hypothetical protein